MAKTLKIEINLDNAAFEDGLELPRIMQGVADYLNHELPDNLTIRDINGNKIGFMEFIEEDEDE